MKNMQDIELLMFGEPSIGRYSYNYWLSTVNESSDDINQCWVGAVKLECPVLRLEIFISRNVNLEVCESLLLEKCNQYWAGVQM